MTNHKPVVLRVGGEPVHRIVTRRKLRRLRVELDRGPGGPAMAVALVRDLLQVARVHRQEPGVYGLEDLLSSTSSAGLDRPGSG